MKKMAAAVTGFLLMAALTQARAQLYEHPFNLHQLRMGQAGIAAGVELVNERVAAVGSLEYGLLPDIEGFFRAGQLYFDDKRLTTLSPISFFYSGVSSIQRLIRSDWECLASASFFGSFADERTAIENSTLGFSVGFGLFHRLIGDSSLTVTPYALASYDMSWWRLGEETSRGGAFSGQIGLEVDLSPNMSLLGSIIAPLKGDRSTLFGVFLSFHPNVVYSTTMP
jgi:hypothetical protein